jgi:hypothetical protein
MEVELADHHVGTFLVTRRTGAQPHRLADAGAGEGDRGQPAIAE